MNAPTFPKNIHIPSGKTATMSEMQDYSRAIQKFARETEAMLRHESDLDSYSQAVDYLNHIAEHYKRELRLFNQAEQKRHQTFVSRFRQQPSL